MTQVVWTKSALADVRNIRRYIAEFNPYAARNMAASLMKAGDSLSSFPYRSRSVPDTGLREMAFVHPYVIRYRIERDCVYILRIRHRARLP